MESERIESDMKIESKREKWLPFGWYSALFFVFFGVGILFHVINGRSFIYNVDAPGQDYPTFLYFGKLLRRFLSTGSVRLYDFSIGLGSDVILTDLDIRLICFPYSRWGRARFVCMNLP